jgi:hypothetical protein
MNMLFPSSGLRVSHACRQQEVTANRALPADCFKLVIGLFLHLEEPGNKLL